MKYVVIGALFSCCILLSPPLAGAQPLPTPQFSADVARLAPAESPLMAAIAHHPVRLGLAPAAMTSPSRAASLPAPREGRSWIGRHPALFGAMIGAAAGLVAAGAMENELFCSSGSDEDCVFYTGSRFAVGAGIGAGIGALVGWIGSLGR